MFAANLAGEQPGLEEIEGPGKNQLKAPAGAAPDSSHNTTAPSFNIYGTRSGSGVPRDLVSKKWSCYLDAASEYVAGLEREGHGVF